MQLLEQKLAAPRPDWATGGDYAPRDSRFFLGIVLLTDLGPVFDPDRGVQLLQEARALPGGAVFFVQNQPGQRYFTDLGFGANVSLDELRATLTERAGSGGVVTAGGTFDARMLQIAQRGGGFGIIDAIRAANAQLPKDMPLDQRPGIEALRLVAQSYPEAAKLLAELAGGADPAVLEMAVNRGVAGALEDLGRAFVEGRAQPRREGQAFEAIDALIKSIDPVAEPDLHRAALRAIANLHGQRAERRRFAPNHYTLVHVQTLIALGETEWALRLYEWSDGRIAQYLPGAAMAGDLNAQLLLARLADKGQGKAAEGAVRWYEMAAANGSAEAAQRLKQIARETQVNTATREAANMAWLYLGLPASFPNADALRSPVGICAWEGWQSFNSGLSALSANWSKVISFPEDRLNDALGTAASAQPVCTIVVVPADLLTRRSDVNDLAFRLGFADLTQALTNLNNPARPNSVTAPALTSDVRADEVRDRLLKGCQRNLFQRKAINCRCLADLARQELATGARFFADADRPQTIASTYTAGDIPQQCINEPALRQHLQEFAAGFIDTADANAAPYINCVVEQGMALFRQRPRITQLNGRRNSFVVQASSQCNHLRGIGAAPAATTTLPAAPATAPTPFDWVYLAIPPQTPRAVAYAGVATAQLCVSQGWTPQNSGVIGIDRGQVARVVRGRKVSDRILNAGIAGTRQCNVVVVPRADIAQMDRATQRGVQSMGLTDVTADFRALR